MASDIITYNLWNSKRDDDICRWTSMWEVDKCEAFYPAGINVSISIWPSKCSVLFIDVVCDQIVNTLNNPTVRVVLALVSELYRNTANPQHWVKGTTQWVAATALLYVKKNYIYSRMS